MFDGQVRPFRVAVAQTDVDHHRRRPTSVRWPVEVSDAAWAGGVPAGYLRDLAGYWAEGYDWRRQEDRVNTIVHWSEVDRGGHFPAMEVPDLLIEYIRVFLRSR
jgi:epoxide hydrolase